MIYKLQNGGVIKLQKAGTKIPRILRKTIKGFGETVDKTTFVPAQVKYYGPTMGKTTAIRTNPNLVDFDAIMRDPSKALLKKYGFSSKYQMFESGNQDAIKEYQDLLVQKMNEFKSNPNNSGKVLVVSQSPVVNPENTGFQFDNEPSIPSKEIFVSRNVGRGGTTFDSEDWGTNLMQRNPNLKIDNRFVSDIEGSKELIHVPKITIPDVRTYHLVDFSMPIKKQGGILKAQKGTGLAGIPILRNLAKKGFELVAKRSNGAQTKSIPTIIGDVITGKDKSFYNINNSNGSNEIDTYLYGKPYNSEFIGDASIGPDYTNYINKNYPNKNIKTYNTHFGDTLYIDNKAKSLVEKQLNTGEVVGGSMGRYAHAPSYIVTTEEGRPYDAGGHLIKFGKDKNGNIVANMSDIYDFLPEDFNDKYDQTKNPSGTRNLANIIGTPFIVRQNNIPVVFKEIVPEYKTEKQKELGDFLSQGGNTYDLNLPLKLSDEQIDEIFDGKDYGDDILNFMVDKGYIKPVYKQGGILKVQNGTFKNFGNTLPENQQDSTDFNVRRYGELNGKPSDFKEAIRKGMYKKEKDGYNANSIAFNEETGEYEFMKSPNHPTINFELDGYNSPKAKKFRNKYQLDTTSIPGKYIPKQQQGGFVTPMTNQFTTKLMEILNKYLRKDQPEQKAVGTATGAYNKPNKIVKDGGDI